jgi:hypothetical protein
LVSIPIPLFLNLLTNHVREVAIPPGICCVGCGEVLACTLEASIV